MPKNPAPSDTARYRANYLSEQEGIYLYRALAAAERDPHLAELYRRLADTEARHAEVWVGHIRQAGTAIPTYRPTWRVRLLTWLARRFGSGLVAPTISSMESASTHDYDTQSEARQAGLPAQERSHARIFGYLGASTGRGIAGPILGQLEGRHRSTGGNQLRAAVLGASDGLTSNLSLVMGVAGFSLAGHTVLVSGLAGLLAGALSMAIGEWLSVQSARELYSRQIAIEREELQAVPAEEEEELALIFQAKGIAEAAARQMARNVMGQHATALDTLAREELGIDPQELGGSAWGAAFTSFAMFAIGALIPVFPFLFGSGLLVVGISLAISTLGFFLIGAGITLTTGTPLLRAGGRQMVLGLLAAGVTFGLGKLVGGAVG
jgi:VIT1/CCC1 family predicted Fe2+/Mn2+ transporter